MPSAEEEQPMRSLRLLMVATVLACVAPAAFAQQALEQQMTAEEFRAAGLDKLSADELANLNRWLQRQVQAEATVAAGEAVERAREEGRAQALQEAEAEAVGRRSAPAQEGPIESRLVGAFNGFARGQRYTLENGQVWEQTDSSRLEGVQVDSPGVRIYPGFLGTWYLRIDGYNARAKVRRVD